MQGPMVLPEDVQIVPVSELPPQIRAQVAGEDGDFALTRPMSRTPSKVIDANAAALLRRFRQPTTIVDAILAYSREIHTPAAQVLEEAYPFIESCLVARLLVEPGAQSEKILPSFAAGDAVAGYTVERVIQTLEDSEVLLVRTEEGRRAALKIARTNAIPAMKKMLAQEAIIIGRIGGAPAPGLLASGALDDGRPFLAIEWFAGDDSQIAAQKIRERGGADVTGELARLCAAVLDAYTELHRRGVIHSDIHPRNVLVSESGEVRIIDFGVARLADSEPGPASRAGVPFFFEPECAQAIRSGAATPRANAAGEQYALGALVYFLLSGSHYLDFSFEKEEMLRQIAEDRPLPLERRGAEYCEALEAVVVRALDKDPVRRFATTAEFAAAFRHAMSATSTVRVGGSRSTEESHKLLHRVLAIAEGPARNSHARSARPLANGGGSESGSQPRELASGWNGSFITDPNSYMRIPEYTGPRSPTASITYGAAGLAHALYRISIARDDAHLLALADAWAERAAMEPADTGYYCDDVKISTDTVGRVSPYHTPSGVAVVQALVANARCDKRNLDVAVERFLQSTAAECENPDLTLGRASVLLGLCLLMEAGGSPRPPALVERGNGLYSGLVGQLDKDPPIGQGSGDEYLGIAHGWAGLLYATLRWCKLMGIRPSDATENRLQQLAGQAQYTGKGARWPVQAVAGSISLSGWCNGSAGHAFLWTLAHELLAAPHYLELAERAAMDAFDGTGGGHGLCCGFAGQAYAQLSLYKHTGERHWLDQARQLAGKAAVFGNTVVRRGEEGLPHSLYKGDVGVAVLIADLERPEFAAMPFFEE